MEVLQDGKEFFDYQTAPSMFANIEKDENGQFPLKVVRKEAISLDTYIYEVEFPNAEWISGLWAGGHYVFHADIDGEHVARKMTPISPVNEKGKAEFVIKIYRPCEEFPDGGKYTSWMEKNINVGDNIVCTGPIGKIRYLGPGEFKFKKKQL